MQGDLACDVACPFSAGRSSALDFPVGQVRRVAGGSENGDVDETRRNILKLAGVGALVLAGGGLGAAAIQYVQPPTVGLTSYPKVQLIDVNGKPLTLTAVANEYNVGTSDLFLFNYPLRNEPNFLLNLTPVNNQAPSSSNPGTWQVPNGVGPERVNRGLQRDLPAPGMPRAGHRLLPARNVSQGLLERAGRAAVLHPLLLPRLDLRREQPGVEPHRSRRAAPSAGHPPDGFERLHLRHRTERPARQRPPELVAGRLRRRDDQPAEPGDPGHPVQLPELRG